MTLTYNQKSVRKRLTCFRNFIDLGTILLVAFFSFSPNCSANSNSNSNKGPSSKPPSNSNNNWGGGPLPMKMLVSSKSLKMHHFKPGVAAEALPDAVHYNKYIPLIFQLKVPEWSMDTLRLNSTMRCPTDALTENNPLCPVAYHFERLLSPLADSMRFAKNIYTPTEGWSYFGKFSCEIIDSHFFHLSAHVDELHLYTDKLKASCPLASTVTPILKNVTSSSAQHITMANNRFNSHMENNKDLYNNEYKMVQMAGYMGLQTAKILTKYIDTVRWSNAFTQCQNSRLSIGLVNSFWLRNALMPVQKIADANGYKLSIPVHEYLPHYYKLPLTDCILGIQSSKKTTMLLRVLVPVMKKDTKYTRFRLTKIPYLITEGDQKKICEIDGFDPRDDFLVQENLPGEGESGSSSRPVITLAPDCFESELCFIPEQPRRLVVDPCLKGLMNGSLNHIRDHCSFDCFPIESEELLLPIIVKVATNQYSITGSHKSNPIEVFCDGKLHQTLEPNNTNGVMQVIMPCNCDLRYKTDIYRASRPCEAGFEAHYLSSIPIKLPSDPSSPSKPLSSATASPDIPPELGPGGIDIVEFDNFPFPGDNVVPLNNNNEKEGMSSKGYPFPPHLGLGGIPAAEHSVPASWVLADGFSGPEEEEQREKERERESQSQRTLAYSLLSSNESTPVTTTVSTPSSASPPSSHTGQLVVIWILLVLLLTSNGLLLYIVYKNRLLDLGGLRGTLSRIMVRGGGVGMGSGGGVTVPRSRLDDDGRQHNGNGNNVTNLQMAGITVTDNNVWPSGLNQ